MKVERLQDYSSGIRNTASIQGQFKTAKTVGYHVAPAQAAAPSFGGRFIDKYFPLTLKEEAKEILKYLPKGQRKAIEWMNRFGGWAKGEAAGIGITAIGTGLVAPWPIAYNPIVNHQLKKEHATPEEVEEKHKTQKYSAWRQPVSAVLAIIFQLGVQKPIEKMLQLMTNNEKTIFNGTLFNQSFLNNEDFLLRKVHGDTDKKDRIINEQVENVIKSVKNVKEGDEHIKVGKNIVPTDALAEAFNNEIDDYIDFAKSLRKSDPGESAKAAKVKTDEVIKDIDYYAGRAQDLVENKKELRKKLSKNYINNIVTSYTNKDPKLKRPEAIRKYITKLRDSYDHANRKDMVAIMDHILGKPDETIESACARNLERIDKVEIACGGKGKFDYGKYRDFLKASNRTIDDKISELESLKIPEKKWSTIKPAELKEKIDALIKACHYDNNDDNLRNLFKDRGKVNKGVFFANLETLTRKVYNDLIKKGYREVVSNQYKIFSQITKASVATFIMLPITCTALNWVYPRFMEIVFPGLSGKKTNTQGKGGVS